MEKHKPIGHAAAPWFRGPGARTLQREARAIPIADCGTQCSSHPAINSGAILPPVASSSQVEMEQAADCSNAKKFTEEQVLCIDFG